eukprot:1155240-Pelagomonas_calceolata.AAC.9
MLASSETEVMCRSSKQEGDTKTKNAKQELIKLAQTSRDKAGGERYPGYSFSRCRPRELATPL